MIKLDPALVPFMTKNALCPFHMVPLEKNMNKEKIINDFDPYWCSQKSCLFGLRAVIWFPQWNAAHNTMEFFIDGWRVWAFQDAEVGSHRLGSKKDGDSKLCIFLPLEKIDFSDMEKMKKKIKTILTFS